MTHCNEPMTKAEKTFCQAAGLKAAVEIEWLLGNATDENVEEAKMAYHLSSIRLWKSRQAVA